MTATTDVIGIRPYARGNFQVDAVQLTEANGAQVWEWADSKPFYGGERDGSGNLIVTGLTVFTLQGRVKAEFGDWVWQTAAGDFDVCPDVVFSRYFEPLAAA
jgi:hypothetical protein